MKNEASKPASVRIATNVGKFLDTAAPMANMRKMKTARLYACLRPSTCSCKVKISQFLYLAQKRKKKKEGIDR